MHIKVLIKKPYIFGLLIYKEVEEMEIGFSVKAEASTEEDKNLKELNLMTGSYLLSSQS